MTDHHRLQQVQVYLHDQIPLARAMGVTVVEGGPEAFILSAPLEANHNHLGTAFGGSLSALATLAGYGYLWMALESPQSHVVIGRSSIQYLRPVKGDLLAICRHPGAEVLEAFQQRFAQTGKAPIDLQVQIEHEGRVCVEFAGRYIALR